jgi:hypothetical protein
MYRCNLKEKPNADKENPRVWQLKIKVLFLKDLRRFDNFAAFDTAGANFLSSVSAGGKLNANRLQIRVEPSARFVVRM